MEFQNAQHKQLHELLLKLGYELVDRPFWKCTYIHKYLHGERVDFNRVEDYSILSYGSNLVGHLRILTIDEVLAVLHTRLPSNDNQPKGRMESWGVASFNKYTPDEVAFLDTAALVLIQVEHQGKHLTYAEAYAEAANMLKARRECIGGEHD